MSIKTDKKSSSGGGINRYKFSETHLEVSIKYYLSISYKDCIGMAAKYSAAK